VKLLRITDAITSMEQFRNVASINSTYQFWDCITESGSQESLWELLQNNSIPCVVQLGGSFPAADIITFEYFASTVQVTLIQVKYSNPQSQKRLQKSHVLSILGKLRESWQPHVSDPHNLLALPELVQPITKSGVPITNNSHIPFGPFDKLQASNIKTKIFMVGNVDDSAFSLAGVGESSGVQLFNELNLASLYGPTLWTLVRPDL